MSFNLKKRKIWIAALAVSIVAAFAAVTLWSGSYVSAGQDNYSQLKVFTEVLETVEANYVKVPDTKKLIYGAINGMIGSLDPHSGFMPPDAYKDMRIDTSGQFGGLGMEIGVKDGVLTVVSPIEDTPAYKAGIKAGDKIVKIDGALTNDMTIFDAVKKMRGPVGSPVTISIYRKGFSKVHDIKLVRAIIKIKSVKWKMLDKDNGIGYIKLTEFQEHSAQDMAAALEKLKAEGMKSLILDLRNNPGGLLNSAVSVAGQFLPKGKLVVYIKARTGPRTDYYTSSQYPTYNHMQMIVLVNEGSASASEIVSGALKDWKRAVILGTQTFGKGSVQTIIPLSDGSALRLTTAMYYTPNGVCIQNIGITPDVKVQLAAVDGAKEHPVIRERDLKNHLGVISPGKKTGKKEEEVVSFSPLKEKDDTQLQRAMDILKTWSIFENSKKKAA